VCGIGGIAARNLSPEHVTSARAMTAALLHRGPDSNGIEVVDNCVLANARLAILDLSERGRQPMPDADGGCWITYNGECYNAAELREWLLSRSHVFRSATDTEVVLHLYAELGDACVEKMRGMFAFAIWDSRQRRLLLARDRLGIKPLYYALDSDRIIFGSEIKTLLASGLLPRRIDPHAVRIFLQLGHIPPPYAAVDGVQPLEPGHVATWKDGAFETRRYWDLTPCANTAAPVLASEAISEALRDALVEAMRCHLISDVPVALFLSGGVDSAALGVLAQRAGTERLTALTIGFEDKSFDESESSRRTAELLGIPHNVLTLSAREMLDGLDHAIWAMDAPTVDGLNSYWICRTAARAGFKVALTGQGGDELFGGYASIENFERFTRAANRLRWLPRPLANALLDHDALPFRWRKLSYLAGADDPFIAAELAVRLLYVDSDLARLVDPELARVDGAAGAHNGDTEARRHLSDWASRAARCGVMEKIAYLDVHAHLEPRLLRDGDAMSMAHSLEVRPVFLDHELMEYTFSLPAPLRMQKKKLLLNAMRRLMEPAAYEEIVARPKRGFVFPYARWLSADLRPAVEAAFTTDRLSAVGVLNPGAVQSVWRRFVAHPARVGWSRVWSLFVLQRWCETMKVTR
jgi:asparagine synthase (glutamine-hydrolysing)